MHEPCDETTSQQTAPVRRRAGHALLVACARAALLCGIAVVVGISTHSVTLAEDNGMMQATPSPTTVTPAQLKVQVLAVHPHDASSFTEGMLLSNGEIYESGGLYGQSKLEEADPNTGAILQSINLPPQVFGEGLALVGNRLIQLTWQEHIAFIWDVNSFAPLGQYSYTGEGWGLCYDGTQLVMSDGSSTLTLRDPNTFAVIGQVPVTVNGQPIQEINHLDCVGNSIYANVWQTDEIIQIDEASGQVEATIDASGLLTPAERAKADVLNGVAFDPNSGDFLVTGKLWPKLFQVQFVPVGSS